MTHPLDPVDPHGGRPLPPGGPPWATAPERGPATGAPWAGVPAPGGPWSGGPWGGGPRGGPPSAGPWSAAPVAPVRYPAPGSWELGGVARGAGPAAATAGVLALLTAGLLLVAGVLTAVVVSLVAGAGPAPGDPTGELLAGAVADVAAAGLLAAGGLLILGRRPPGPWLLTAGAAVVVAEAAYWLVRAGTDVVVPAVALAALAGAAAVIAWLPAAAPRPRAVPPSPR